MGRSSSRKIDTWEFYTGDRTRVKVEVRLQRNFKFLALNAAYRISEEDTDLERLYDCVAAKVKGKEKLRWRYYLRIEWIGDPLPLLPDNVRVDYPPVTLAASDDTGKAYEDLRISTRLGMDIDVMAKATMDGKVVWRSAGCISHTYHNPKDEMRSGGSTVLLPLTDENVAALQMILTGFEGLRVRLAALLSPKQIRAAFKQLKLQSFSLGLPAPPASDAETA